MELNEIQPAERGGVLILFAAGLGAAFDFDDGCLARQLLGAGVTFGVSVEHVQQTDCERTRTAQAGAARWDVGNGSYLDPAFDGQELHRLPDQRMFYAVHGACLLRARIAHPDLLVELFVDGDIDELVDAGRNHRAAKAPIKHRQIAAAAYKTNPQGCSANDHAVVCAKSDAA